MKQSMPYLTHIDPDPQPVVIREAHQLPLEARLWESADTHRLNAAHWSLANKSQHLNTDMARDLDWLVYRARYEFYNNPIVQGIVNTHSIDLITPSGPTLDVQSENPEFNRIVEQEWSNWWQSPETSGELSGPELMRRWNQQEWLKGDVFSVYVNDNRQPSGEITLRLMDIDPNRVRTPAQFASDDRVALGVKRNRRGRAMTYYVEQVDERSEAYYRTNTYRSVTADDMLHAFESYEPGQSRGFPRLAAALDEIGQLRDYDKAVLDASRLAAEFSVMGTTSHDDIVGDTQPSTPANMSLERGTVKHGVPGWEYQGLQATQPHTQYVPFRHEKLRSIGRVAHMPLLVILLSAEQSNFSQSRMDVNVFYARGLRTSQFNEEHRKLRPIFKRFYQELSLLQRNGQFVIPNSMRNTQFRVAWHWEPLPQANELQYWQAKALKRQLLVTTPTQDNAELGQDFAEMAEQMGQDNQTVVNAQVPIDVTATEFKAPATAAEITTNVE